MDHPIHSRGTGRSGPKRKTGCLTCRRRKVRCDESKPICANCVRLRLDCGYVNGKTKQESPSFPPSMMPTGASHVNDRQTQFASPQTGLPDFYRSSNIHIPPEMPLPTYANQNQLWSFDGVSGPAYAPPFQDIFFSSLDSFNVGLDFANSDAFLGPQLYPYPNGLATNKLSNDSTHLESTDTADGNEERRKHLIEHFVRSANPVSVILPTHTEWTSASRSLLAMANESAFLLSAICALSALHLYITKDEDSLMEAFRDYKSASRSVNAVMDHANVDDRQLKQAFATIFLLTHVELMAQTTSRAKELDWPLQHLQSAHHRVRQHSDRIRLWTGTSKRLLTWMTLLQTKAEYNSGYTALEHSSATLSKSIGDPFARRPSSIIRSDSPNATRNSEYSQESAAGDLTSEDVEEDTRTMAEVAYDTVNQPGFDFFLKAQAFTSRIISLDRYHRTRGTLESEFETLKDGQQISTDLHTLWATRPTTMSFLRDPNGLEEALQPRLAKKVLLNLRVYVANFYAQFIYLHRVAFKTYPSTPDVTDAIARIIGLAKDIVEDSNRSQTSGAISMFSDRTALEYNASSLSPAITAQNARTMDEVARGSDSSTGLPATMLWPLFLAAIEGSLSDREFLLQAMREMDMRQVPNAARTVFLLEEVLRRQDREGRRVDHRSVRQDLFEGELSVLY